MLQRLAEAHTTCLHVPEPQGNFGGGVASQAVGLATYGNRSAGIVLLKRALSLFDLKSLIKGYPNSTTRLRVPVIPAYNLFGVGVTERLFIRPSTGMPPSSL